jgi:hypothetical protein
VQQTRRLIFSWRAATTAVGAAIPGSIAAVANSDPMIMGVVATVGAGVGSIGSEALYSMLQKWFAGHPPIPQAIIALAAEKMKQDFMNSIIHDRLRVIGAAEVASKRYEVVGQARHSPLISLPPPRSILFPSPSSTRGLIQNIKKHPKRDRSCAPPNAYGAT